MTPADTLALLDLGIAMLAEVQQIRAAANPAEAQQRLVALKDRARKAFRKVALALHPDQNGGDPVKTAQFVALSRAVEALCCVELHIMHPQPPPQMISYHWVQVNTTASTSTTSATYSPAFAFRVVHLRPI